MADKEFAIHNTETNGTSEYGGNGMGKKPTFMQKYKAHMKKWWWVHLIIFIAVTLIIVLCLVYAAFPHIAQQGVDASTIEITSLMALDPTPTSFHFIQDSLSHSYNTYHPWLDPFNASLSLAGSAPYCMVVLPGTSSGDSVPAHIDQIVQVTDLEGFTDYNAALLNSESIQARVNGSTWLYEMKFPAAHVSYDKITTLTGFNSFKGFNITDFHVSIAPNPDGTNINGSILIPNPTVITFALGNLTFNNFVDDTFIGNATIQNLVLQRGNHSYPMVGYTNQSLVLDLIETKYTNGILPIKTVGNSSIYNGQHLTYYEKPFQQNVQMIQLNVGAALAEIGLNITSGGGGGLR